MSLDWTKAGELVQSPRVAGATVLGAGIATAIAWARWDDILKIAQSITQSGASLIVLAPTIALVVGAFLFVCFCSALLVIAGSNAGIRRMGGVRARRAVREKARLESENNRTSAEIAVRTQFPFLSSLEYRILTMFEEHTSENAADPILPLPNGDATTQLLVRKRFLALVAPVDEFRSLYGLTPAAAGITPSLLRDRRRQRMTKALEEAGEPERTLLQLFGLPEPLAGEPAHPMLAYKVYLAIDALVDSHVLRLAAPRMPYLGVRVLPATETILLTPEATPFVEERFLGGKASRTAVKLDLNLILGSGVSGSGSGPAGGRGFV